MSLSPGETVNFQVNYQAQGAPSWISNANNQLLSNFRLIALANFPKADFASGIIPTETIELIQSNEGRKFTIDAKFAWSLISPILLFLVCGLGSNRQTSLAAIICTISGGILLTYFCIISSLGVGICFISL